MEQLVCTLESVSGCGLQTIQIFTPKVIKVNDKLNNLIDYLVFCNGDDYILVLPPRDIHKEALKIKCLYPLLEVEVINTRIKLSF
jgi:signal recognition particle receptor subunit beta